MKEKMRRSIFKLLNDQHGTTPLENVIWVTLLFVIFALMALILVPALYQEFARLGVL